MLLFATIPYIYQCPFLTYLTYDFSHRLLWHRTWPRAVAFQPLSTRYETERPDSPIEGFVFRLWQWEPDVGDTFTVGKNPPEKTYVSLPIVFILKDTGKYILQFQKDGNQKIHFVLYAFFPNFRAKKMFND